MLRKSLSFYSLYNCRRLLSQKSGRLDWTKQEQIIMEPFEYLQKVPSKHHRMLTQAFNHWLQVPKEKAEHIEDTLQILHTMSLLFDDIQDDSAFRYGAPAAHRVFGLGLAANAGTNALVLAGKKILALEHPSAPKIFLDRVGEMHQGQGIDLYWRDHFICPTEVEHIDMLEKKAASFFVLHVELLQLFSKSDRDYTRLATNIGVYYPMVDDYYNLFNPKALQRLARVKQDSGDHTICSDITECKITLPIIHALQFPDIATELTNILKLRTKDPKLLNYFISLLKKHGSDEYIRDALRKLEADIRTEIDRMGGNASLTSFMDDLSFQDHESRQE